MPPAPTFRFLVRDLAGARPGEVEIRKPRSRRWRHGDLLAHVPQHRLDNPVVDEIPRRMKSLQHRPRLRNQSLQLGEPNDRRGVRVVLTTIGQKTVDGALTDLLDRERDLLVGLSANEQQQLADLLRSLSYEFDA